MKKNEVIINNIYLKNRVLELGIKQWWLAEQVGVDRKTVGRWIHGKVKTIQSENAEALASILECNVKDLSLSSLTEQLASNEDQKAAAKLIASSSLIDKLGPIGEWDVIESLLKATIVPNLPINVLGELYNLLTISAWRQSKIDEATLYNIKAEDIGTKSGDNKVLANALLSKANIFSWRGKTTSSIKTYHQCLKLSKYVDPKIIGSTYSNLGAVLYESGNLTDSIDYQKKAIDLFKEHGKYINLSIAHGHLAMNYLTQLKLELASIECDLSITFANKDNYKRGQEFGKLILSEIKARKGLVAEAQNELKNGLDGFNNLGINEGLNFEYAGRISRLINQHEKSKEYLYRGISLSEQFPIYQASLYYELALTLRELKNDDFLIQAENSTQLFNKCEAPLKVELVKKAFNI